MKLSNIFSATPHPSEFDHNNKRVCVTVEAARLRYREGVLPSDLTENAAFVTLWKHSP